jgi:UTP--glucose-1-phosphate uridylyltransferase
VVTAAGQATRFRPFSAFVPKEMLPLGDTPALGHVISECAGAGASRIVVATRPGDTVVAAYVEHLRGNEQPVEALTEDLDHGYGNGTPLLTLREQLQRCDLFGVAYGDDILLGGADLAAMHELAAGGADAVIAAQVIDVADIGAFGVIDVHPDDPSRVLGIRQRPDPATVGEPLAVVSRLILGPRSSNYSAPPNSLAARWTSVSPWADSPRSLTSESTESRLNGSRSAIHTAITTRSAPTGDCSPNPAAIHR